ncbi:hypothetical protein PZB74_20460 [Porifericola rhodea]|uniref:hypothetical protein n=1 Tax=Porifericola rhodea TaxID=930972 RepID=UPI00266555DF|nr:hypothetical protein [Porifericola rhodea]WKN31327.1 hypothetical protein PZB74_20460 [Porifericola rhodea]
MSKKNSQKKYEEIKAYYKKQAEAVEKELHMDLVAVRHEYVPHHLKNKFLTGCAIFGSMYLAEKLIFGKRLPRIVRFTTSLSAIVWAPKVYQKIHDKITGVGEQAPIEMEVFEDQLTEEDRLGYDGMPILEEEVEPKPLPEQDTILDTPQQPKLPDENVIDSPQETEDKNKP